MNAATEAPATLVNLHVEARELSARGALASPMAPSATRITQGLFAEVVAARAQLRKKVNCAATLDLIEQTAGYLHPNLREQVTSRVRQIRVLSDRLAAK